MNKPISRKNHIIDMQHRHVPVQLLEQATHKTCSDQLSTFNRRENSAKLDYFSFTILVFFLLRDGLNDCMLPWAG